jgi:aminopeptidase
VDLVAYVTRIRFGRGDLTRLGIKTGGGDVAFENGDELVELSEMMRRYAHLVVSYGLNVQAGQFVQINSEVAHRGLVRAVVEEAYRRGAGFVNVEFTDPMLTRARIVESRREFLRDVPAFFAAKFNEIVDVGGANLKILGPEYPDYMIGLDPAAVNQVRKASYSAAKHFYTDGIGRSRVQWCVIAAATPAWGERVFPELKGAAAEERLWREIFKICRVERADYLERWSRHNVALKERAGTLNRLKIRELRFTGPGSDLVVGLSQRSIFKAGADRTPSGHDFSPNLPTEECFTTPDWRRTSGVVSATRPFYVNGNLIKDLRMSFKNGEISEFSCSEGRSTLEAYLTSDSGARRLGEVALVGTDSPVFRSGLVFQEILYDENAACHIALGSAYKGCLEGGGALSDAECAEIGCNVSSVHTDIMISSDEVTVRGVLEGGKTIALIENGEWVGDLSAR